MNYSQSTKAEYNACREKNTSQHIELRGRNSTAKKGKQIKFIHTLCKLL